MRKGFAATAILLVIVAMVLIVGTYFFVKNRDLHPIIPLRTPTSNSTANPLVAVTPSAFTPKLIPNNIHKIAFVTSNEVWVVNEDGSSLRKLLSHPLIQINNPSLSNDDINSLNEDRFDHFYSGLSWSRDGKWLAVLGFSNYVQQAVNDSDFFKKYEPEGVAGWWDPPMNDIYLINVETGKYNIIPGPDLNTAVQEIQWSYDDKQIIYFKDCKVMMANIDPNNINEKAVTSLPCNGNNGYKLTWRPDVGKIFFIEYFSYDVTKEASEPSLVSYDYINKITKPYPFPLKAGYRINYYKFLNNGHIVYESYSTLLDNKFEITTSNVDGSDSKNLYNGICPDKYELACSAITFGNISPTGEYATNSLLDHLSLVNLKDPSQALPYPLPDGWSADGNSVLYKDGSSLNVFNIISKKTTNIEKGLIIYEDKWAE